MYFDYYEEAKEAAIKQSKMAFLFDVKVYVKYKDCYLDDDYDIKSGYFIGFTPDHPKDAYIYNGEIKND